MGSISRYETDGQHETYDPPTNFTVLDGHPTIPDDVDDRQWFDAVIRDRFGYGMHEVREMPRTRSELATVLADFLETLGLEPVQEGERIDFNFAGRATTLDIVDAQAMHDHYDELYEREYAGTNGYRDLPDHRDEE